MVTLYGKGAIQIHDGKATYTPVNGAITVPEKHLPRLLAMGWNRFPPPPETAQDAPGRPIAPPVAPTAAPVQFDALRGHVDALALALMDLATSPDGEE